VPRSLARVRAWRAAGYPDSTRAIIDPESDDLSEGTRHVLGISTPRKRLVRLAKRKQRPARHGSRREQQRQSRRRRCLCGGWRLHKSMTTPRRPPTCLCLAARRRSERSCQPYGLHPWPITRPKTCSGRRACRYLRQTTYMWPKTLLRFTQTTRCHRAS